MNTNKLFNGFNNGRDTTDGVGGNPPDMYYDISFIGVDRNPLNMSTSDFIEAECDIVQREQRLKKYIRRYKKTIERLS